MPLRKVLKVFLNLGTVGEEVRPVGIWVPSKGVIMALTIHLGLTDTTQKTGSLTGMSQATPGYVFSYLISRIRPQSQCLSSLILPSAAEVFVLFEES